MGHLSVKGGFLDVTVVLVFYNIFLYRKLDTLNSFWNVNIRKALWTFGKWNVHFKRYRYSKIKNKKGKSSIVGE